MNEQKESIDVRSWFVMYKAIAFVCCATFIVAGTASIPEVPYRCQTRILGELEYFENLCYDFVRSRKTWPEANITCMQFGGTLATIRNETVQRFIENKVRQLKWSKTSIWIGAYAKEHVAHSGKDVGTEGQWVWITGEPLESGYRNWARDEPNQFWMEPGNVCANIHTPDDDKWFDHSCYQRAHAFICQYNPLQQTLVPSKPSTTAMKSKVDTEATTPVLLVTMGIDRHNSSILSTTRSSSSSLAFQTNRRFVSKLSRFPDTVKDRYSPKSNHATVQVVESVVRKMKFTTTSSTSPKEQTTLQSQRSVVTSIEENVNFATDVFTTVRSSALKSLSTHSLASSSAPAITTKRHNHVNGRIVSQIPGRGVPPSPARIQTTRPVTLSVMKIVHAGQQLQNTTQSLKDTFRHLSSEATTSSESPQTTGEELVHEKETVKTKTALLDSGAGRTIGNVLTKRSGQYETTAFVNATSRPDAVFNTNTTVRTRTLLNTTNSPSEKTNSPKSKWAREQTSPIRTLPDDLTADKIGTPSEGQQSPVTHFELLTTKNLPTKARWSTVSHISSDKTAVTSEEVNYLNLDTSPVHNYSFALTSTRQVAGKPTSHKWTNFLGHVTKHRQNRSSDNEVVMEETPRSITFVTGDVSLHRSLTTQPNPGGHVTTTRTSSILPFTQKTVGLPLTRHVAGNSTENKWTELSSGNVTTRIQNHSSDHSVILNETSRSITFVTEEFSSQKSRVTQATVRALVTSTKSTRILPFPQNAVALTTTKQVAGKLTSHKWTNLFLGHVTKHKQNRASENGAILNETPRTITFVADEFSSQKSQVTQANLTARGTTAKSTKILPFPKNTVALTSTKQVAVKTTSHKWVDSILDDEAQGRNHSSDHEEMIVKTPQSITFVTEQDNLRKTQGTQATPGARMTATTSTSILRWPPKQVANDASSGRFTEITSRAHDILVKSNNPTSTNTQAIQIRSTRTSTRDANISSVRFVTRQTASMETEEEKDGISEIDGSGVVENPGKRTLPILPETVSNPTLPSIPPKTISEGVTWNFTEVGSSTRVVTSQIDIPAVKSATRANAIKQKSVQIGLTVSGVLILILLVIIGVLCYIRKRSHYYFVTACRKKQRISEEV